jgi:hypothetical protein
VLGPNSVYTDTGVGITNDIDDATFAGLCSGLSATWNFCCQYNNSNMPDNCGLIFKARPLSGTSPKVRLWPNVRNGYQARKPPHEFDSGSMRSQHSGGWISVCSEMSSASSTSIARYRVKGITARLRHSSSAASTFWLRTCSDRPIGSPNPLAWFCQLLSPGLWTRISARLGPRTLEWRSR